MAFKNPIHIVGAGLAGSECALQLAHKGYKVVLHEMRGKVPTPAHKTDKFGELVCSNSFGSQDFETAPGQLKWEAQNLNSFLLKIAQDNQVPAGSALGIDRERFSEAITSAIQNHPNIEVRNELIESIDQIPRPAVIATGPLTHESLAQSMLKHLGQEFLYFYDAIAPIIDTDSINMDIAFKASRWDKGSDYINCPMDKEQYYKFIEEIKAARKVEPKDFEKEVYYFESCLPVEVMVERGDQTLSFGPMRAIGLTDPKTGKRPFAVVQLRQENKEATAYNMVGFQTKMAYPEQKRVFRMIPGLENAEFLKLGSIHRNLYVNSTKVLNSDLSSKNDPNLYFAGQISGVEGYFESICIGILVANFIDQKNKDQSFAPPPRPSAMGSLMYALTGEAKDDFQPTNINFGLLPAIQSEKKLPKDVKKKMQIENAKNSFLTWLTGLK